MRRLVSNSETKRKRFVLGALLCSILLLLTACSTPHEETFQTEVDTGDIINIICDTSTGFVLPEAVPFELKKGDAVMAEGSFIDLDTYNFYKEVLDEASLDGLTLIESGDHNGNEYYFYEVKTGDMTEWDCIERIAGSKTAVIFGSLDSLENLQAAFKAYRFELADSVPVDDAAAVVEFDGSSSLTRPVIQLTS